VRGAIDDYIDSTGRDMRSLAEQLRNREISIAQWQREMESHIARVHLANAAAARGGWDRMRQSDYGRVGRLVRDEYAALRGFARQIQDGIPLDGRFTNRVNQYVQAGRHSYHIFDRREQRARGMDDERSILHARDSCDGCLSAAARGWQPIGTLPLPGERDCRRNCHCTMRYRSATERVIGNEPTHYERQNPDDPPVPAGQNTPQRVRRDLDNIREFLNRQFDTPSNWSGRVRIRPATEGGGSAKLVTCDIVIAEESLRHQGRRWSTLLHEQLHSINPTGPSYRGYRGWIEGVHEQVMRRLRPDLLRELNLEIPETALHNRDVNHIYQPYVRVIESLRTRLGRAAPDEETFYYTLFATPPEQYAEKLLEWAQELPPRRRAAFERALATARTILEPQELQSGRTPENRS
jgi:hypothetical protein